MKTYTPEELKAVFEDHAKWLKDKGGSCADLSGSNLSGSNLRWSNLRGSNLSGSDLSGSDLRGSNLSGSDLRGSDLRWSNLSGSNLSGSNLRWSDLPAPTMILLADWGPLTDISTLELMRLDASAHPDKEAFCRWAAGGPCPYNNVKVQRVVNFQEKKELWSPGPPPTIWEAMKMILDEKCPGWDKEGLV